MRYRKLNNKSEIETMKELFNINIVSSDEDYNLVRNPPRPEIQKYKSYMEKLWDIYEPYADKDFPEQLPMDFHARFWEMYLACMLLQKGYQLLPKRKLSRGPEIAIELNETRRLFIEAVAPSKGGDNNPDKVPRTELGRAVRLPNNKITLRYCSAIKSKFNAYERYLKGNVVTEFDSYFIALNSCKIGIEAKAEDEDCPRVMKAVLPIGDEVVEISGKNVNWNYQYKINMKKSSGIDVPTNIFLNYDYAGLSGLLYAWINYCNKPEKMGNDIVILCNPCARNPVPQSYFNFGKEYSIFQTENTLSWSIHECNLNR